MSQPGAESVDIVHTLLFVHECCLTDDALRPGTAVHNLTREEGALLASSADKTSAGYHHQIFSFAHSYRFDPGAT
ncbi:hypothetical protein JOF38_000031 [Paenarthrobacter nicotinovorans]|nr:hypothetical protein [Paenarthrobacter nicotinovorans]